MAEPLFRWHHDAMGQDEKTQETTRQILWAVQNTGPNKPCYLSIGSATTAENSRCVSRSTAKTCTRL
eukprot:SAG11_NODE_1254_length_5378_cov_10.677780_3_plen_67_part_00